MAQIEATDFEVATGRTVCWSCKRDTPVFALKAPAEALATDTDSEKEGQAPLFDPQPLKEPFLLSGITAVSPELARALSAAAPGLTADASRTAGLTYWMNHCSGCGAKIGDFYLFNEPDGPFFAWPRHPGVVLDFRPVGPGSVACELPEFEWVPASG